MIKVNVKPAPIHLAARHLIIGIVIAFEMVQSILLKMPLSKVKEHDDILVI